MSVELNVDAKVEESNKVEAVDSKKVEFGGEVLKEINSITAEPDSYLETASDYTTPESIGTYLNKLAGGVGEAFHDASTAYGKAVEGQVAARSEARLEKAMTEPRFNASDVTKLVTDARGELSTAELEKQLADTKAIVAELKAELAETKGEQDHLKDAVPATTTQPKVEGETVVHVEPVVVIHTAPVVDVTPTVNEMEHHVVAAGESLSKIALQEYGNPSAWPKIYEANKDIIGNNPALIRPGQNLIIPPIQGGEIFNNIIVPDKPHETPPPVTPPDGGTGHAVESNPEMLEKVARLEQKIESLTKDPQGVTERNVTNDPNIDGQRIALKDQLQDLDRDLLKNRITPETYNNYTARYDSLHDQYNRVSIGLYKNHVDAVPLQFADKSTLDRLQYNETILSRAVERGASADEVGQLVDNSWRDYDDAKMGRNTNHHMPGGFVPNPTEGQAIADSIPDKHEQNRDKAAA